MKKTVQRLRKRSYEMGILLALCMAPGWAPAWAANSEQPPVCVASLLRNADENEMLKQALSKGLSSLELSHLEIHEGAVGFTECLAEKSPYDTVLIVAHAATAQRHADSAPTSVLILPISGVDTVFPYGALKKWISHSSAKKIIVASCKTQELDIRQSELGADPRLEWVESTADPVRLTLSVDEVVAYLKATGALDY